MASNKAYPLVTRRQILHELSTDPAFVAECVGVIHGLYLARRRGEIEHGGWMASQGSEGARLAERFAAGEQSHGDEARAAALLRRYSRALAVYFRERQLIEHPELSEVAALYGVAPKQTPAGASTGSTRVPAAMDEIRESSETTLLPAGGAPVATAPAGRGQQTNETEGDATPPATTTAPSADHLRPRGLDGRVLSHLVKHPGSRTETIARELRVETGDVSAALRSLRDKGLVRSEGAARGTTYFPIQK